MENRPYFISLYMVTYRNPECVQNNLTSLFDGLEERNRFFGERPLSLEVNIINNHPDFTLDPQWDNLINVFNNTFRSPDSCGHLARDWNFALIRGFKDLNNPVADQVICCHDDVVWHPGWLTNLLGFHHDSGYDFYIGDYGCSVHSYLPSAVKTIGLWDERFCNIAYHEADYMLRAMRYNRDKSTINDHVQGRVLNPTTVVFDHPSHNQQKSDAANHSLQYHPVSRLVFERKWGIYPEQWGRTGALNMPNLNPLIEGYLFYPYFEKDVTTLDQQNYVNAWEFKQQWHNIT